jgi:hypothetical protein
MRQIKAVRVETTGMNTYNQTKVLYAAELVLAFFQSHTFRLKFYATPIKFLAGESDNSISKRLNKDALFELFMTGQEEWNGIADYEIDLLVTRYNRRLSRVIGYVIPMKPNIYVNGKFFDDNGIEEVADNLCHEYSHTLGFRHSGEYIEQSIPYYINIWFKAWLKANTPMPKSIHSYKTICERSWRTLWLIKKCYKVVV